MARPIKKGVDYFSHDTNIAGKTIYTLEQLFGNDGYAFWFKLLEILGQQEGLYYDCSITSNWIFLTAKAKISEEKAKEIIKILVDLEAIDKALWTKKKIIWSDNFVNRVKDVFAKRGTETPHKPSFCDRNTITNVVSDNKSTQSKVKESKVNKSKVKERESAPVRERSLTSNIDTSNLSFWQQKFHEKFPDRETDADLEEGQDMLLLLDKIKFSTFLKSSNNLSLKWFKENYDKVMSGAYKDFDKNISSKTDSKHDFDKNNNLMDDIGKVEL